MAATEDPEIRRVFEQLSLVTAGESAEVALYATAHLFAAILCVASDDKPSAFDLLEACRSDIDGLIEKDFDWHRAQAAMTVNTRGRG